MRTSCIRLRANARVAVLYEDFLEICDGNMLAAMLLATLIYWTDTKIAQKDENLWIWKTHEGFQEDLMYDKPGMKPPHRTTISSALDLLKSKDFIEWRKNPKMALDRTRQYLVHQEIVQAAINKLPTLECRKSDKGMSENRLSEETANEATSDDTTSGSSNVGKPTMQSRKTDNALSEKQHCNVGKPTSNTIDYISSDYSSERESTDDSAGAPSETPTQENTSSVPETPSKAEQATTKRASARNASAHVEKPARPRKPRNRKKNDQQPAVVLTPEAEPYIPSFEKWLQEATEDPDTGYFASEEDKTELLNLLKKNAEKPNYVTPEKMRLVLLELWKQPRDERSGFSWQDNMTLRNVCKQYPKVAIALAARAREKQEQAKKQASKTNRGVSGLGKWVAPGSQAAITL